VNPQVLLLQPWVEDFYCTPCRTQPAGLAYLAASIKSSFQDLDVQIYDTLAGRRKKSLPWPAEFKYLKPYYGFQDKSPFALFHQYYRFGQSKETIEKKLQAYRPLFIGISCLFTPYYRESLKLARICRSVFPDVPIVMGGSHATLHPQTLLFPPPPFGPEENLCDYVLRGEAEETICELTEYLLGKRNLKEVRNLVTRQWNPACPMPAPAIPDRMRITLPSFTGLNRKDYRYMRVPLSVLITSRSCPHRCSFCTVHSVFGTAYEVRDIGSIVDEISIRYREGIRHFDIEDDNFTHNKTHCMELLDRIRGLNLPITLSAMNGLCYTSLDRDILQNMKLAGFDTLNLSLVSAWQESGGTIQRPHNPKKFFRILDAAAELDLRVIAYVILGMPGQSPEEMWDTLTMLASSRCLIGPSPFYFTPGSPVHKREKDNPSIRLASAGQDPFFSARLTAMDLETDSFNRNDVYTCFRMSRVFNYIKEGIDKGLARTDAYFSPAVNILKEGRWHTDPSKGSRQQPFSPMIHNLLRQTCLVFRGYRTDRELVL
jgi:radical SAM superfamily enzyme YgiQ (UPF0313 family)